MQTRLAGPANFFSQCALNHCPPGHVVRVFSVIADVVGACSWSMGQFITPTGSLSVMVIFRKGLPCAVGRGR